MTRTTAAALQTIGLVTLGGCLAGVIYVIFRYLIGPYSGLGQMFAGLYLLGGLIVVIVPGFFTGVLFLGLLYGARRSPVLRDHRRVASFVAAILAGATSAVVTCVGLVAFNEYLNPFLFVVGFGLAAIVYLLFVHRIVEGWYQRSARENRIE